MGLPEWCQTHTLKEFFELVNSDICPKKEKKMNEITQVTEVEMAVAPVMAFNPTTGEFEVVTETVVTDEGPVANEADITVH